MRKSVLLTFALIAAFIGTTSAQSWNETGNAAGATSVLGTTNAVPLNIITNNVSRMRIDTGGRIGINTTTPSNLLTVRSSGSNPSTAWAQGGNPVFVGYGEGAAGNANFSVLMASDLANGRPTLGFKRSRGTLAAPTAVVSNDYLTSIPVAAFDGSAFQSSAAVNFYADGTPSAGNAPARISFVTGSNSGNAVERLAVGSTGNINFNGTQMSLQKTTGNLSLGQGNLNLLTSAQSIQFPAVNASGSNPMINMFASGTLNKERMVIAHSPAFQTWGLQYVDSIDQFNFLSNGTSVLATNLQNQRVGIGNAAPTAKLHVTNEASATGVRVENNFAGNTDLYGVYSTSKQADGYGFGMYGVGGYRGGFFFGDGGAYTGGTIGVYGYATGTAGTRYGVYGYATGGTDNWGGYFPVKTYTNELRVGGTAGATGYVAAINGKLIATEIRIEAIGNWPDYVFGKNYNLMSLDELEKKIKSQNHLPGIPAADDVKKEGIMLGEMQTKTMEKVEENTLYILQLNNKIKELEKKIEQLTEKFSNK